MSGRKLFRLKMKSDDDSDMLPGRRRLAERERNNSAIAGEARGKTFKRSVTLTGSTSSFIRSASEHYGNMKSDRVQAHHLAAHRRKLFGVLVAVVVVCLFLVWFLYQFTAFVTVPVSASDRLHNSALYTKTINDYFGSHPLERFNPVLNVGNLKKYIEGKNPEVLDVEIRGANSLASTEFGMSFRKPVASWSIGDQLYYVDENGVSFLVNHFVDPTVKVVDSSGIPQVNGSVLASGRFLKFVGRTVSVAKQFQLIVQKAVIPSGATHEIDIVLEGYGFPIKMSLDRPVGEQVEDISHAVLYVKEHELKPQYVDVRVSGKAFYK